METELSAHYYTTTVLCRRDVLSVTNPVFERFVSSMSEDMQQTHRDTMMSEKNISNRIPSLNFSSILLQYRRLFILLLAPFPEGRSNRVRVVQGCYVLGMVYRRATMPSLF